MWKRETTPELEPEDVPPELSPSRHFLEPSTFASRKPEARATAKALAKPVMVGIGESTYTQINHRTRKPEVIQVELFYEKGRPSRRYYRLPGNALPRCSTTPRLSRSRRGWNQAHSGGRLRRDPDAPS